MKYTKRKVAMIGSIAAAEIKKTLEEQDPPLGNNPAATLIGVNYETMRAVTNDRRIPSVGIIYGLARALDLPDTWVEKVKALREKDLVQKRIAKATSNSNIDGAEAVATLMGALTHSQLKEVKNLAMKLALQNRGKK